MTHITWTEEDEDGNEITHRLPATVEVCSRCGGEGHHTNPNIDGNGISDWSDWDDEDRESYLSGAYDVTCEECHGNNVVTELDEEAAQRTMPDVLERYLDAMQADAESRAETRYWQRLEAYACGERD